MTSDPLTPQGQPTTTPAEALVPERVRLLVAAESVPPELQINTHVVERMLTRFIHAEVTKVGFHRVVLGLSGGIDSAVSLYLAANALGADNVLALLNPYATSSPESLTDALACVEDTGVQHQVIPISEQIDAYYNNPDVPQDQDDETMRLRRGNKMARERMTIWYDFSVAFNGLVLGTSNKTELLLGYGTLYGDMAHALNPLGDLYKTQIRQLAVHLDVPTAVVSKPPTADLYTGQTDEAQIGYPYRDIDRVLIHLVEERLPADVVIAKGFDAGMVRRIMRMVHRSQYKRRLPVIAKVSTRTIDRDFRYSRDWGY